MCVQASYSTVVGTRAELNTLRERWGTLRSADIFGLKMDLHDLDHFELSARLRDSDCPRVAVVWHKHVPGTLVSDRLQTEINAIGRFPRVVVESGFTLHPCAEDFPGDPTAITVTSRLSSQAQQSPGSAHGRRRIAVIDSGDVSSPWMIDVTGGNVIDTTGTDFYGHGSAVASVIRALRPDCDLVPIRVLNPLGLCESYEILDALIISLFSDRFDVVNVSLSNDDGQRCSTGLGRSIEYVCGMKATTAKLVAAAGNHRQRFGYPASLSIATRVQALDWNSAPASYNLSVPLGLASVQAFGGVAGDPIATLPTRDGADVVEFFGTSAAAAVYSASVLGV